MRSVGGRPTAPDSALKPADPPSSEAEIGLKTYDICSKDCSKKNSENNAFYGGLASFVVAWCILETEITGEKSSNFSEIQKASDFSAAL
jgi:hypothetical protein